MLLCVQGLLKQATAVLDNLVKEKGQHAEISEHAGKVVMSMAEIVFKVVAIGLQGLEGFVLYADKCLDIPFKRVFNP